MSAAIKDAFFMSQFFILSSDTCQLSGKKLNFNAKILQRRFEFSCFFSIHSVFNKQNYACYLFFGNVMSMKICSEILPHSKPCFFPVEIELKEMEIPTNYGHTKSLILCGSNSNPNQKSIFGMWI